MKKLLCFLLPILLLTSCQPDYHNKVEKVLQSSVYKEGPIDSVVLFVGTRMSGLQADSAVCDSITKGYVDTERIHTEYYFDLAFGTYNFTHKTLLVKKTPYQNCVEFWHTMWRWVLAILSVIVFGYFAAVFVVRTSKGAGLQSLGLLVPCAIALACFGAAVYPWSDEGYITQAQYDINQEKDGDQRAIDWNNIQGL